MACMYRALDDAGRRDVRLIGFDSFKGLPDYASEEGWSPGLFASTRSATERYLAGSGVDLERVELVEGWFEDTLTRDTADELDLDKVSLVLIDCDLYSASKAALWFSEQFIDDEAVLIFDDWGWRSEVGEPGQQEAFHEFLTAFPALAAERLPAYRPEARVFLLTRSSR